MVDAHRWLIVGRQQRRGRLAGVGLYISGGAAAGTGIPTCSNVVWFGTERETLSGVFR